MIPPSKRESEAFHSASLFEAGIGQVVVTRFKASGASETGVFLVDVYCLGVKNGFFVKSEPGEYETLLQRMFAESEPVPLGAPCARKLVESSVAYAAKLGIPPHRDYKKACRVLGGINARDCETEFVFGKDGKPFYMQGPNDSPAFVRKVLFNLENRCGEGNYHFTCEADAF